MDEEVKELLREIRDESIKTNQRLGELNNWALKESEKERAHPNKSGEGLIHSRQVVPKKELWWLLIMAVILVALYVGNELFLT